jgi:uncharacterized delta-60 repeat protein
MKRVLAVVGVAWACAASPRPAQQPAVVVPRAEPEPPPTPVLAPTGLELRGELDASFGTAGVALFEREPGEQRFSAITSLRDGSVVAAGYAPFADSHDISAARITEAGVLDKTFGDRGWVRVGDRRGFGHVITQDDKGRLLVGGYFHDKRGTDTLLARLDARGGFDPSFGKNGVVVQDVGSGDQPHAIFARPDGRIIVVGYHSGPKNAAVAFRADGSLDPAFGNDGVALFGGEGTANAFATAGAMGPAGEIVAGGYFAQDKHGFVARLDASGRADMAFGKSGVVVPELPIQSAWAVGVDRESRIYLGAQTQAGPAVVLRFKIDGSLDRKWGLNGVAVADASGDDQLYAILFDKNDNVIGIGFRGLADEAQGFIVRFTPDGGRDKRFADDGRLVKSFGGGTFLFAGAWDSKGRLVAVGDVWNRDKSRALVIRVN